MAECKKKKKRYQVKCRHIKCADLDHERVETREINLND